jgi:hypothetical protein
MNKLFILNLLPVPEEKLPDVVKGLNRLASNDLQWKLINTGGSDFIKKLVILGGLLATPVCPRTDCACNVVSEEDLMERLLKETKIYGKVLIVTSYPEMRIIGDCVEVDFPFFSTKSVGGYRCYLSEFE